MLHIACHSQYTQLTKFVMGIQTNMNSAHDLFILVLAKI